ncbi:hypothetical protein EYZ11_009344 [Aspergillus tanneri]|nr:hypothetical protein EYZ11_009344 [Aspergillus tanneri]
MQAVQTLIIPRPNLEGPFTVYALQYNGAAVPQYYVEASKSKPNLIISRFQSAPAPPPPQPMGYGHGHGYGQPPYYQPPPQPHGYMPANPYGHYYPPQPAAPPPSQVRVGTVAVSSLSSKINLSIHNIPELQMKRPDILSSGHRFPHPRLGNLEWKEEDLFKKRFKLVDQNKTVLARFSKWKTQQPNTMLPDGKKYAFLIYIQADPELLDWIVVSGLGAVEYRIKSDKDFEKAMKGSDDDDGGFLFG